MNASKGHYSVYLGKYERNLTLNFNMLQTQCIKLEKRKYLDNVKRWLIRRGEDGTEKYDSYFSLLIPFFVCFIFSLTRLSGPGPSQSRNVRLCVCMSVTKVVIVDYGQMV